MIQQIIEIDSEDVLYIEVDQILNNNLNALDIRCPICLNVYLNPISCDQCLNHFCRSCHQQKKSMKCPLCNQISQAKKAFPLLVQILSELKIKCSYSNKGCTEICDYDAYEKHYRQCEFQDEKCKLSDGKQICNIVKLKKDIEEHRKTDCLFRICHCCHCNKQLCYLKLRDHEENCSEKLESCDKCQQMVKLKDRKTHLEQCEKNFDKCRYCQNVQSVRELKIHTKECPLRPVCCVGCSQQFTLSVYYSHQRVCPKFPLICQHCEKKMHREKLATHTFTDCLAYIKQSFQAKYDELEKKTMVLEFRLKQKESNFRFSNRYKDADIFLNQNKTIAFVKHNENRKKDRFILFNRPLENNEEKWTFKFKQINSAWFAVGITDISVLYTQKKYQEIGHGSYLVSSNGTLYNHHDAQENSKESNFRINTGDILEILINKEEGLLTFINTTQNLSLEVEVEFDGMVFYGCACLRTSADEIQIIE